MILYHLDIKGLPPHTLPFISTTICKFNNSSILKLETQNISALNTNTIGHLLECLNPLNIQWMLSSTTSILGRPLKLCKNEVWSFIPNCFGLISYTYLSKKLNMYFNFKICQRDYNYLANHLKHAHKLNKNELKELRKKRIKKGIKTARKGRSCKLF